MILAHKYHGPFQTLAKMKNRGGNQTQDLKDSLELTGGVISDHSISYFVSYQIFIRFADKLRRGPYPLDGSSISLTVTSSETITSLTFRVKVRYNKDHTI